MRRVLVRRSATAFGIYLSVVLGTLSTIVAARIFSKEIFGLFAVVVAATAFVQVLFDLTVEEALVKYGFRYIAQEDFGRLRQLYRSALLTKVAGAGLGAVGLLILAPFAGPVFGDGRLEVPLLIAAALPLGQSLEGLSGTALFLRSRYDIRSLFLAWSMGLRLAAIAIGAHHGLRWTIVAMLAAQVLSTASIGVAGRLALHRWPWAPRSPLGGDRRGIVSFVAQSSVATGVTSVRTWLTRLLLGIVTAPTQVGFYQVAQAPQSGFQALSAPARMVLLTEQTRDWEHGRQSQVMRGVRRYTVLASALMVLALPPLLVFMPDLIKLVYTSKYLAATNAARVFLGAAAVQFAVGWTKSFPVAVGRPNLRIWTHGIESLVILPLVVVLGRLYGATGAAFAVLAGMCAFALAWAVIVSRIEVAE